MKHRKKLSEPPEGWFRYALPRGLIPPQPSAAAIARGNAFRAPYPVKNPEIREISAAPLSGPEPLSLPSETVPTRPPGGITTKGNIIMSDENKSTIQPIPHGDRYITAISP